MRNAKAGDPFAAETLGRHLARRIAELADTPDTPLFFGRLDIDHERYQVGRQHVTDPAGEPQDELVRAELEESICVQGAPGTGFPNPRIWHTSEVSMNVTLSAT